ncbi:MAG TPA: ABC transporter substrate-binding protein, partial [Rhodospirillales bacterium]|nr:ABC transporter substrate-binding protein [Rhodospirillales bacterium]
MALIAVTHPAKAVVKEAGQFIQSLSDKAAQILQKQNLSLEAREEMVRNLLNRSFSINEIGKEIFGSQWAKIDKGQQSDFLKQFREWVLKAYAACLGGYKGQAFEILKIDDGGKKGVRVRNKISLAGGGGSFICDWRVSSSSGKYKILDVGFEGSNLRRNQKRLFSNTIRLHGVVGLTELLKMRNSKLPVVGGAFEAGTVAYQKTDFLTAMSIWKPLAE